MSPKFKSQITGFPVFTVVCASDNEFLIGGGGGATKAGVKNTVMLIDIKDSEIKVKADYVFPAIDDACMNLAVHPIRKTLIAGVNSSEEIIKVNILIGGT